MTEPHAATQRSPASDPAPLPLTVSVTIRSYEREPIILPLIERLRAQSLLPLEIVVIDSGSGPAVIEPLRAMSVSVEAARALPPPARPEEVPVVLFEIPNATYQSGRALNQVAAAARGDLIGIISQDALPSDEEYLELLCAPFANPDVAGSYARQILGEHYCPLGEKDLSRTYPVRSTLQELPDIWFVNTCSVVRRTVWEKFPFREDAVITEDHQWAKDVLEAGHKIFYEGRAAVHHFHHKDGAREIWKRFYLEGLGLGYIHQRRLGLPRAVFQWAREVASDTVWLTARGKPWYVGRSLVQRSAKYAGLYMGFKRALVEPAAGAAGGPRSGGAGGRNSRNGKHSVERV